MEKTNRLSQASSPYLKQHANNPVDWYEWGEEALSKARTENKPIIISVGYAACHWCHVMAQESFSDQNLADYMNQHFVCIKVDREERPDIDRIYMEAAQLITGRGGWPLNAFALPDGRPFYAGTYFPPSRWMDALVQLSGLYQTDYPRILKSAESIAEGMTTDAYLSTWNDSPVLAEEYQTTFQNHIKNIDFDLGGTLGAPKFMMPVGMEFLLQYHYFTNDILALDAVNITLGAMAKGGIYDQIGGGFARYSTDQFWKVPHFEKMLYDNAQLISLYAHAFQATGNPLCADIIEHTIAFAERELLDACGGFYASIDADSEHEEGKFYVWTKAEVEAVLDPKTAEIVVAFYQITDDGNWEHGKNILHYNVGKTDFASEHHITESELNFILKKANHLLFEKRSERIRPTTDDKILTSWNALMVSAYVAAYKALGKDHYLEGAIRTARFLEKNMMTETALLYRVYKDGKVSVDAFLDDYALLAQAFVDLYEATFDVRWLNLSNGLAEYACRHFDDESNALFYYTSDHSEKLIVRKHEVADNVIPAANSVFAHVLLRLSQLFENEKFGEISEAMLSQVKESAMLQGVYFANWASLMGRHLYPKREVAIVGVNASSMALELQQNYLPDTVFAGGEVADLPLLKDRFVAGKTLIYVCENRMCNAPVESVEEALALLRKE